MFRSTLLAAALVMTPLAPAFADDNAGTITITGTASVSAKPTLALVNAGVESVGATAREALNANSDLMTQVFGAISKMGIEDKDVGTSNFNISQNWTHGPGGSKPDGYRVSNQVTLRLRDVEKVGDALDALTSAGVNQAGNIQFSVKDADTLLDTARKEAVGKARKRAELYASAAGVSLGKIMSINEGGGYAQPPVAYARMEAAMSSAPPIAPGEQDLSVSVTITWALKE